MCDDVIPEDDQDAEPNAQDVMVEIIDLESQKRLWVRAIIPLLQMRNREQDQNGRVQLAIDLMHIAACERVRRILRADLPDEDGRG